MAAELKQ
jgi:chromosome segregation ATPase